MSGGAWDGVCPRTVHHADGMGVCGRQEPCPEHGARDGFPCHWLHDHGSHPWTPLIEDPEHPRVMYAGEVVTCPGKRRPIMGWCASRVGSRPLVLTGHHDDHDGAALHGRGDTCRGFVGSAEWQIDANQRADHG